LTERERQTQKERERESARDRDRDRDTEREREKERERERERPIRIDNNSLFKNKRVIKRAPPRESEKAHVRNVLRTRVMSHTEMSP